MERRSGEDFALAILLIAALGVLCGWLAGCAPARLRPEAPPPSAAVLAALLAAHEAAPVPSGGPADVTLVVMPRVVLWPGSVRLRCLVPDAWDVRGRVRLALEGTRATTVELPDAAEQVITIDHVPCGKSAATCTVDRQGRPTVVRSEVVEVRGGVCDEN